MTATGGRALSGMKSTYSILIFSGSMSKFCTGCTQYKTNLRISYFKYSLLLIKLLFFRRNLCLHIWHVKATQALVVLFPLQYQRFQAKCDFWEETHLFNVLLLINKTSVDDSQLGSNTYLQKMSQNLTRIPLLSYVFANICITVFNRYFTKSIASFCTKWKLVRGYF